jgi:hypothetical protein
MKAKTFVTDDCQVTLRLSKSLLKELYEALKLVDKQDLMDNETVFVEEEK